MKLNLIYTMPLILANLWLTLAQEPELPKNTLSEKERTEMKTILESSRDTFIKAVSGLTDEQLSFKIDRKSWSIAECMEHVTIAELYFKEIVIDEMQKPSAPSKRKKIKITDEKIRERMLSKRWKAKSPEIFKPDGNFETVQETLVAFKEARNQTIEYVLKTNDDVRNHFWRHPLTGTIDLYQTLILMSAHLERHTEQIENIKNDSRFP